jgi:hypothetical protein
METETCEGGVGGDGRGASGRWWGIEGRRRVEKLQGREWGIEGATADGEGRGAAARWWRRKGRGGRSPQRRGYADVVR